MKALWQSFSCANQMHAAATSVLPEPTSPCTRPVSYTHLDVYKRQLCARAAALDLAFLTLEVRASNAPAIAPYRKHGFQAVGQRRNYYQKPDEDALLMTWFRREAETI